MASPKEKEKQVTPKLKFSSPISPEFKGKSREMKGNSLVIVLTLDFALTLALALPLTLSLAIALKLAIAL